MGPPLVYVLVVNWNGREHLAECFESLFRTSYGNARYVLIDNASTDGSAEFVRDRWGEDCRVEIIECGGNLGWSGGNNRGIETALAAGAKYVLLLNNDTAVDPEAIERLVEVAEREPPVGAMAPKLVFFNQPELINSIGLACSIVGSGWDLGIGRLDGPQWNQPRKIIGVCGAAMFIRCEVLSKTGLFPTDFEIYLDDLDLCLRIWSAGYEIWSCPGAVVRHKFSATMGEGSRARRKYYLNTRNRLRLILRNFPTRSLPKALAWYAVAEGRAVGRALRDGEPWRAMAHVRSWCSGVSYVPRAIRARAVNKGRGFAPGRFWPLIRTDRLFFEGTEIPEQGWYRPRRIGDREFWPMSARAWRETPGGALTIRHANPYPVLGPTHVEVYGGGQRLAELKTERTGETRVNAPAGRIEFVSRRVFAAEETGERVDLGGWIRVDSE